MKAQTICFSCPVREQCKKYKEDTHSTEGIWSGEYSQRKKKGDTDAT